MRPATTLVLSAVFCLILTAESYGQSPSARARYARDLQAIYATDPVDSCRSCRASVSGTRNDILHVLDPYATVMSNDYRVYPTLHCSRSVGFRRVIYYYGQGKVYASHNC